MTQQEMTADLTIARATREALATLGSTDQTKWGPVRRTDTARVTGVEGTRTAHREAPTAPAVATAG